MITNKDVLDYLNGNGIDNTINFVKEHSDPLTSPTAKNSFRNSIYIVKKTVLNLQKSKRLPHVQEKIQQLLSEKFCFPKKRSVPINTTTEPEKLVTNGAEHVKDDVLHDVSLKLKTTKAVLKQTEKDLSSKIKSTEGELKQTKDKLKTSREESALLSDLVESKQKELNTVREGKNQQLKRLRSDISYQRNKVAKLECLDTIEEDFSQSDIIQKLQSEKDELEGRIAFMESEKDCLLEQIAESKQREVQLFDPSKGAYTTDAQKCVHHLLENHVPASRVGPVIEACLELVDKVPNRIPSLTTVNQMNIQRLELAQQQIVEEVTPQMNTTLATDETSKYGTKSCVYNIFTSDGRPYVLGLREMATKSAQDTLDIFKDILFDLDKQYYSCGLSSQNILFQIRNTMSDRAATEKKFNQLLEDYRAEVCPLVMNNWQELDEPIQENLTRMNNFFCSLHTLVHIAEVSASALDEVERAHFDTVPIYDARFTGKESACVRLIRTACDAFAYGGHAKTSCHGRFMSFVDGFLKENKLRSLPMTPFRHNRFNIIFHNASSIFLLHRQMISFLEGDATNKWVLHDLSQPFFMAGVKAMGLINKFVTTPLWKLVEKKDVHVMDLNTFYAQLIHYLEDAVRNIDNFVLGELRPFGEIFPIKEDAAYHALIEPSDYDANCKVYLSVILPSITKLLKEHFKPHLPGGTYHEPSADLRTTTKSVPKHNKHCEANFAYLDLLSKWKPNMKSLAAEAYVMFTYNKTSEWLANKEPVEQKKLLDVAYKKTWETQRLFRERQLEIKKRKEELIRQKLAKAEETKKKALEHKVRQTNSMIHWGLWQTEGHVDIVLQGLSAEERREALKAQLRFRKNVLGQKPKDKSLLAFSQKGHMFSNDELTANVKALIRSSFSPTLDDDDILCSRKVKHTFEEKTEGSSTLKTYLGHVISRVGFII